MLKKLFIAFILILTSILLYTIWVIYGARDYTQDTVIKDYDHGQWRIYQGEPKPLSIKIENLSQDQLDWLIKIQDPGFRSHSGIDLSTPGAGLTTITQSIVKKLYFANFKPGIRKFKQSIIAYLVVDKMIQKDWQLRIFINSVYMGQNKGKAIYGFNDAALAYYGKIFAELTEDEFLSLVAMLVNPTRFHVQNNRQLNAKRVDRIKAVLSGQYRPKGLTDIYYDRES